MEASSVQPFFLRMRRFWSRGGVVALVVFLLGRLALEPFRDEPHYDPRGMEAFSTIETFLLRKDPHPVEIAFFGSSQSVWAIRSENIAADLGENPERVRNLAVEGGTPFDMWNLIRRNEEKLKHVRVAIIEVNPFVLRQGLDSDPRVSIDIAQHATLSERLMLTHMEDRLLQVGEWLLPLLSVRRGLESTFLDVIDPEPGCPIYPEPDQRTHPAVGWRVDGKQRRKKERQTVAPELAAKRMVGGWRLSKLQDHSFRQSLAWFAQHGVRVIFHELPVHPEVIEALRRDPSLEHGRQKYEAYLDTLYPPPFAKSFTPDPVDCGITADDLADRTHLNENGARKYSAYLSAKLRSFLAPAP